LVFLVVSFLLALSQWSIRVSLLPIRSTWSAHLILLDLIILIIYTWPRVQITKLLVMHFLPVKISVFVNMHKNPPYNIFWAGSRIIIGYLFLLKWSYLCRGRLGPQGFETFRLSYFLESRLTDGGEVESYTPTCHLYLSSQEDSWYTFLQILDSNPGPQPNTIHHHSCFLLAVKFHMHGIEIRNRANNLRG
jgi:hypothetical protein